MADESNGWEFGFYWSKDLYGDNAKNVNRYPLSDDAKEMIQRGLKFLDNMKALLEHASKSTKLAEQDLCLMVFSQIFMTFVADFGVLSLARSTGHADWKHMKERIVKMCKEKGWETPPGFGASDMSKGDASPKPKNPSPGSSAADFFKKQMEKGLGSKEDGKESD